MGNVWEIINRAHCAVVHGTSMYIYGGFGEHKHLTDLLEYSFGK